MGKNTIAVNAGPGMGWNTETLIRAWTMFDPEAKKERRDTVFPKECRKVFETGKALAEK